MSEKPNCPECGCVKGHRILCKTGNDRAIAYQSKLKSKPSPPSDPQREGSGSKSSSIFLSNLHYFFAQTDGTYAIPNSSEGDLLKTAKREIEKLLSDNAAAREALEKARVDMEKIMNVYLHGGDPHERLVRTQNISAYAEAELRRILTYLNDHENKTVN